MTKETLTEWGLTAEQADKVMEGLNGSTMPWSWNGMRGEVQLLI